MIFKVLYFLYAFFALIVTATETNESNSLLKLKKVKCSSLVPMAWHENQENHCRQKDLKLGPKLWSIIC